MTAQTDFNLTAHSGGSTLSYAADFWDTTRAQWDAQSKLDPSTWINPPTGAKRITSPAVGQFVLEQNTGTPAAPVWTTRFTFDSTANTNTITAASTAAAVAQANAYRTTNGKATNLPANINLQSWADSLQQSGLYDCYLSAPQNGLPSGWWYIDYKRHADDTPNALYHQLEARSFGAASNAPSLIYQNTCGNGVWTGWKQIWNEATSYQVKGMAYSGVGNTGAGKNVFNALTTGSYNTANGLNALLSNTTGGSNTANGANALYSNTTGSYNTANGFNALSGNTTGGYNTANGVYALLNNTTGISNTANGFNALSGNTTGGYNTANGVYALLSNTTGGSNTANGAYALYNNTTGSSNTANGLNALLSNTTGSSNTANGLSALSGNTTGNHNTTNGANALYNNTTGSYNTANGANALYNNTVFYNISGLGAAAQVTNSNQVQLGDSATTTYAYGAVQNRSDLRDKTDVQPTDLGLDFINALKPVKARWDYREDYRQPMPERPQLVEPSEPVAPAAPTPPPEGASREVVEAYEQALKAYEQAMAEYKQALEDYEQALKAYEQAMAEYEAARLQWLEDSKLKNIKRDGSKARSRHHQMLIAQDVQAVCTSMGVDFGGLQDHSLSGGDDVMSLGYEEFIPVLIKAVQELATKNVALQLRLTAAGI